MITDQDHAIRTKKHRQEPVRLNALRRLIHNNSTEHAASEKGVARCRAGAHDNVNRI